MSPGVALELFPKIRLSHSLFHGALETFAQGLSTRQRRVVELRLQYWAVLWDSIDLCQLSEGCNRLYDVPRVITGIRRLTSYCAQPDLEFRQLMYMMELVIFQLRRLVRNYMLAPSPEKKEIIGLKDDVLTSSVKSWTFRLAEKWRVQLIRHRAELEEKCIETCFQYT